MPAVARHLYLLSWKPPLHKNLNAAAWVDGEWFNTGDLGVINELGHIQLTGRAKDLIIRGGHNIDPQVIEDALLAHSNVVQAVAIGQPDVHSGEIPVAYVVLKDLESIPVTAVGKVFKPVLRNKAAEFSVNTLFKKHGISAQITSEFNPEKGQVVSIHLSNSQDQKRAAALLVAFPVLVNYINS